MLQPLNDVHAPESAGQLVSRLQRVVGVDFVYQPPPKSRVPYAAALKGQTHAIRCS